MQEHFLTVSGGFHLHRTSSIAINTSSRVLQQEILFGQFLFKVTPYKGFSRGFIVIFEIDKGYRTLNVSRFGLLFSIGLLIWSLIGCNDTPNPVGVNVLSQEDFSPVRIDTFYASFRPSAQWDISTQYLDRFMLGINTTTDKWEYKSWAFLKFYQWPDSLLGDTIVSAKIHFKVLSSLGASPLNFSGFYATKSWLADSLTFSDLTTPGIYYSNTNPIVQAPVRDTSGWVTLILDADTASTWFRSNTDTTDMNDGIVLQPKSTDLMESYYSFNTLDPAMCPVLEITYMKSGVTATYTHSYGASRYVADVSPPPSVQKNGKLLVSSDSAILVQDGISYYGDIPFDTLHLSPRTLLYGAVLELTLKSSSPSISHDSLIAFQAKSDGSPDIYNYADYGTPYTDRSNRVYKFNVRNLVAQWIKGTTSPELIITGAYDGLSFDLFTLWGPGSATQPALRPRIILTYYNKL